MAVRRGKVRLLLDLEIRALAFGHEARLLDVFALQRRALAKGERGAQHVVAMFGAHQLSTVTLQRKAKIRELAALVGLSYRSGKRAWSLLERARLVPKLSTGFPQPESKDRSTVSDAQRYASAAQDDTANRGPVGQRGPTGPVESRWKPSQATERQDDGSELLPRGRARGSCKNPEHKEPDSCREIDHPYHPDHASPEISSRSYDEVRDAMLRYGVSPWQADRYAGGVTMARLAVVVEEARARELPARRWPAWIVAALKRDRGGPTCPTT